MYYYFLIYLGNCLHFIVIFWLTSVEICFKRILINVNFLIKIIVMCCFNFIIRWCINYIFFSLHIQECCNNKWLKPKTNGWSYWKPIAKICIACLYRCFISVYFIANSVSFHYGQSEKRWIRSTFKALFHKNPKYNLRLSY